MKAQAHRRPAVVPQPGILGAYFSNGLIGCLNMALKEAEKPKTYRYRVKYGDIKTLARLYALVQQKEDHYRVNPALPGKIRFEEQARLFKLVLFSVDQYVRAKKSDQSNNIALWISYEKDLQQTPMLKVEFEQINPGKILLQGEITCLHEY